MNYSIMCGENDQYAVSLDKSGNTYTVGAWNKYEHHAESIEQFPDFASAFSSFLDACLNHDIWNPGYVNHSETAFANID